MRFLESCRFVAREGAWPWVVDSDGILVLMLAKSSTGFFPTIYIPRISLPFFPTSFSPIFPLIAMVSTEEEARALSADQKPPVMHLVAKCNCHSAHDFADFYWQGTFWRQVNWLLVPGWLTRNSTLPGPCSCSSGIRCGSLTQTPVELTGSPIKEKKNWAENTQYKMPQTPLDLQGEKAWSDLGDKNSLMSLEQLVLSCRFYKLTKLFSSLISKQLSLRSMCKMCTVSPGACFSCHSGIVTVPAPAFLPSPSTQL